jgi:hypothetical protein
MTSKVAFGDFFYSCKNVVVVLWYEFVIFVGRRMPKAQIPFGKVS